MRIALAICLCLALGSVTFAGEREYTSMMIKIKGFDEEMGLVIIEPSSVCKRAKYAVFANMSVTEMKKFAEEMEGKNIGIFVERCEEILKIAPVGRQGEKEVF